MANTAELYGEQQGITRDQQDEFALRSQKCADDAYKAGRLQEELAPVPLKNRRGEPTGEGFIFPARSGRCRPASARPSSARCGWRARARSP